MRVTFAITAPSLLALGACLIVPTLSPAAGIPEPSVVLYGTIRNVALENVRAVTGTVSWCFIEPGSGWSATFTTGVTNVLDQFSYVLEVPCEQMISTSLSTNALSLSGTPKTFDCSLVTYTGAATVPVTFADPEQGAIVLSTRDRGRMIRVDLQISAPCVDLDNNGLCDSWELQYLGYIGVDPLDDPDHDGMSNAVEYRAGTDPLDRESVFQFLSMQSLSPTSVKLDWQSADGRYYSILKYPSLKSTNAAIVLGWMLATGPVSSWVDTNASPNGVNFYRLRLEP